MVEYQLQASFQAYYTLLLTINVTIGVIIMVAACACCRKKHFPKNELLGLEGMVKLKNPDEVIVITNVGNSESQADLNVSTVSNADSDKRASTAAHRSLPDIPVADANGDTGSELYETVADKRLLDAQNSQDKSPTPSLKKQISVSQHSSISQADDVSSPYSRVKNSPHDYAKVRTTEHPYAQLNAPSTSANAAANTSGISGANISNTSQMTLNSDALNRNSHHSDSTQNINDSQTSHVEIPAASAIAGMISASQDLPYMTPPLANQHFSGDSQDSSKGYTSISVREPLANILAQQPRKSSNQRNATLTRDITDSHYATVSDDSDETYAAIEDPNMRNNLNIADIYTSGSETYAQIQPMQSNSIVVSVEINNASASAQLPSNSASNGSGVQVLEYNSTTVSTVVQQQQQQQQNLHHHHHQQHHHLQHRPTSEHITPVPPPVDSLRAQMHSRQASSSSNNSSSMGNLGSPKPEKRQANSPLPPTPKSNASQNNNNNNSNSSNLTSGRNSVISVIECGGGATVGTALDASSSASTIATETSPQRKSKNLSPSKDIEGMYAKVMKKNKFSTRNSSSSSQNNSPVMTRKLNNDSSLGLSPLDSAAAELMETHKINISADKSRTRSNSYSAKDHGYETIPADAMRNTMMTSGGGGGLTMAMENRKSDCYTNILQKERQLEGANHAPHTTLLSYHSTTLNAKPPNNDKHYETIAGPSNSSNNSDPGYETLLKLPKSIQLCDLDNEKKSSDYDPNYEVLKVPPDNNSSNSAGLSDDGYAKVLEKKHLNIDEDSIDGYSKIKGEECEDGAVGGYSTISEVIKADANHNYASILETKAGGGGGGDDSNETDSDHYARIAETQQQFPSKTTAAVGTTDALTLNLVSSSPLKSANTSPGDVLTSPRLPEMPITSPSSVNSSSMLNNSSAASSTNITTASTSTMSSSRQTPTSLSQYESLTGSETDPNYESVCYLNTSSENPYERLQTDTQLSSPLTPDEHSGSTGAANGPKLNVVLGATDSTTTTATSTITTTNTAAAPTTEVIVDDYFQV